MEVLCAPYIWCLTKLTYMLYQRGVVISYVCFVTKAHLWNLSNSGRTIQPNGTPTPNDVRYNWDFTSGRSPYMLVASNTVNILMLEGGPYDTLILWSMFESLTFSGFILDHNPKVFFWSFRSFDPRIIFT